MSSHYSMNLPMGIPCPGCQEGMMRFRGSDMTCIGFHNAGGDHDHDDNRHTFYFDCDVCAWKDSYSLWNRRPVPGCPWQASWFQDSRDQFIDHHRYVPAAMVGWCWTHSGKQVWFLENGPEPMPAPYVEPPPNPFPDFFQQRVVRVEERLPFLVVRNPEKVVRMRFDNPPKS